VTQPASAARPAVPAAQPGSEQPRPEQPGSEQLRPGRRRKPAAQAGVQSGEDRLPSPRRLSPGERRGQILDAARRLLDTRPIDEVSVEAVAAQVGVSPGLLFHYFGTQRKFRHAVIQAAARELLGQIEPDPALSAAEQLHAALGTFTAYVARNPGRYLAVVRFSSANREMRNLHNTIRNALSEWLLAGLAAAGVPMSQPVRATVAGWLAFVEEALLTWLDEPQMAQDELVALCERACFLLVENAVADPVRWPELDRAIRRRPAQEPEDSSFRSGQDTP
jgi:AcrR family transcriptional regulator